MPGRARDKSAGLPIRGAIFAPLQNEMQESSCLNQGVPYVSDRARRISRADASKSHPDYSRIAESRQRFVRGSIQRIRGARITARDRNADFATRDGIGSRKLWTVRSWVCALARYSCGSRERNSMSAHQPLSADRRVRDPPCRSAVDEIRRKASRKAAKPARRKRTL